MVNRTLYISGQLGLDPATSELVGGGVVPQTRQAFKNVKEILTKAKSDFKVELTFDFWTLDYLKTFRHVFASYFEDC